MNILDKITNYLIFAMLLLVILILGTVISTLAMGDMVLSEDSSGLGLLLQVISVGWLLWFVGKKLYRQIILPAPEVQLPAFAAYFAGALRGILFAAVPGLLTMGLLLWLNPAWLFQELPRQLGIALLAVGVLAGICFPPFCVARRMRLWLLTALIAQFFMLQGMTKLLQIRTIRFDYKVDGHYSKRSFPVLDSKTIQRCLPATAKDVQFYGYRGLVSNFIWKASATPEEFQTFATANNYKLTRRGNYLFHRSETLIIWYDETNGILQGYFSNTKLFKELELPQPEQTQPAKTQSKTAEKSAPAEK